MPAKGSMFQTAKRTLTEFGEDNLTDAAAALTYYALLSVFPALVAMIALVSLVGNPQTITKELTNLVSSIGPASAAQTFKEPIASLAHGSSAAGILLIADVAAALWTASGYVGAFMRASNTIYEVEEGRSFYQAAPAADARHPHPGGAPGARSRGACGDRADRQQGRLRHRRRHHGGDHLGRRQMTGPARRRHRHDRRALLRCTERPAPRLKSIMPGALLAVVICLIASAGFAYYVATSAPTTKPTAR